jgi:myo-inositol-1(or 4)-monophosphatase
MKYMEQEWTVWCGVAERAAVDAGALIRLKMAEPRAITSKGFRDVVTDADVAAQQIITDRIQRHFPDHGFLAEEKDSRLPAAGPVRWIIDPIDGTSNYSRGIPIFCVSVAVACEEQVVAGVIYDPMREELFRAVRGQGAQLNSQLITVSQVTELSEAVVGIDWGRRNEVRRRSMQTLEKLAPLVRNARSVGSSALALAWVASGRFDAYLNHSLSAWDIAAGALLIQEAGGLVSNTLNQPFGLVENTSCVGANALLHAPLLALLA